MYMWRIYDILYQKRDICLDVNGRCVISDEMKRARCASFLNWEAGDRIQNSQLCAGASPKRGWKTKIALWMARNGGGWLMDSPFPLSRTFARVTLRIKGWVSVRTVRSSTWPESSPGTTSICTGNYIREGRKKYFNARRSCPSKAEAWKFENNKSWRFREYCKKWTIMSDVSITSPYKFVNAYCN